MSLALPCALLLLSSFNPKKPQCVKVDNTLLASNMLSCTQADLVICNYGSIISFVDALVAELNNQLNNCNGKLDDCNPDSTCCYYVTTDFTFTSALNSGKNPWFYSAGESCSTYTCSGLLGGGTQHNDLTVSDQNEILTRMRNAANNAYPCGQGNGNSRPISSYRVYRTPSGTPSGPCSADGPNCYNVSIRLEVKYLCGCQY